MDDTKSPDEREAGGQAGSDQPKEPEDMPKPLKEQVIDAISTCYDPEIPVNIYELGLIYDIDVSPSGAVHVKMTLTSPACPVAGTLPGEVEHKIKTVEEVTEATVELVWDPPWTPDRMSEAAKLDLNL